MGQRCSYMNTFALQVTVSMTKRMICDLWGFYLAKYPDRKEYSISQVELADLTNELDLTDNGIIVFPFEPLAMYSI